MHEFHCPTTALHIVEVVSHGCMRAKSDIRVEVEEVPGDGVGAGDWMQLTHRCHSCDGDGCWLNTYGGVAGLFGRRRVSDVVVGVGRDELARAAGDLNATQDALVGAGRRTPTKRTRRKTSTSWETGKKASEGASDGD